MRPFLVVDDDEIALGLIQSLLEREGWGAETASDGLEAWERLDAEPDRYDLVILDRMMPRMDGIEVLRRVNADHRFEGRVAEVWVRTEGERLIYRIKDQGAGFDWVRYLDIDPERLFDSHGRGIAMSRQLAFDSLDYLGAGNEVEAVVTCSSS